MILEIISNLTNSVILLLPLEGKCVTGEPHSLTVTVFLHVFIARQKNEVSVETQK